MNALLPPSSSTTRLSRPPAISPTRRPAADEPVNETAFVCGERTTASPVAAPPGSTCTTPSGRPACPKTRASTAPPENAVFASGLTSTALPSASSGATERMASINGAFQGAITPTTPTGIRRANPSVAGSSTGSRSPCDIVTSPAPAISSSIALSTSCFALAGSEPLSRTSTSSTSARMSRKASAARVRTSARSRYDARPHSACACAARAPARSTSCWSAMPARPTFPPSPGETTGSVPPPPVRQPPE